MQAIPLQPTPSQIVSITLGNQACQISIYQKRSGLYCDLFVNNSLIIGGVICENLNRIVRSAYLNFAGDLTFYDNAGVSDPDYTGIGSRFFLLYLEPNDVSYDPFYYIGAVSGKTFALTV